MLTEREALSHYLANQRRHIVDILAGLTDDQLRHPVLPSGWSCVQLVNHLTWDVEHFWFQCVVAGNRDELDADANAWELPPASTPAGILAAYQRECQRADEIIALTDLSAAPRWWPVEIFPDLPERSLRETILHITTETATHAGHLDAARELLDERQWLVLTPSPTGVA
jgi:uncharacterized damage-inducible protein DinB